MLSCIATFIATWMFISIVGYLFTDTVTFKEVAANPVVLMIMLIFGWIPSVIVGGDLDKKINS
jgi:hypothetical protein